ncbi:MAG: hypothetical protein H8D32_01260, partial [Dehalococcoidia bacterium]|nr:hypothetical protein [Dehalococcoidia bacterium]
YPAGASGGEVHHGVARQRTLVHPYRLRACSSSTKIEIRVQVRAIKTIFAPFLDGLRREIVAVRKAPLSDKTL